jgi:hypothetical protein
MRNELLPQNFTSGLPAENKVFLPPLTIGSRISINWAPLGHGQPIKVEDLPFAQEQTSIYQAKQDAIKKISSHFAAWGCGDLPIDLWDNLEGKRVEIAKASNSILNKVVKSNPEDNVYAKCMIFLLKTAESSLIAENILRQENLAKKHGFLHAYQPLADILRYNTCQDIFIKMDGTSTADILNDKNSKTEDYYKASVQANLMSNQQAYDRILDENIKENPFLDEYKITTSQIIQNACKRLSILTILSPEVFNKIHVPDSTKAEQEVVSRAKDIVKKISSVRSKVISDVLFDPSSDGFPSLMKSMGTYLETNDADVQSIALVKAGFTNFSAEINGYRDAITNSSSENPEHAVFYAKLAESLRKHMVEVEKYYLLLAKDVPTYLLNEKAQEDKPDPSFDEIKKIAGQIFNRPLKPAYDVKPTDINFYGLKVPENIMAKPLEGQERGKIELLLTYKDSIPNLLLVVDIRKKDMREGVAWQFLEDKENMGIINKMQKAALLSIISILHVVQNRVEIDHKEQKMRMPNLVPGTTSIKNHNEVYVPPAKIQKIPPPKPLTFVEKLLMDKNGSHEEKQVFKQSIIVSEKTDNIFPKDMSKKEIENLTQKMEKLPKGLGDVKMLEVTKNDKVPLYRGKFDKRYRVIVRKATPEETNNGHDGTQYYVLVNVLRRNDDYKDLKRII